MDSSFFSQQMSYCLLTLLVYMALKQLATGYTGLVGRESSFITRKPNFLLPTNTIYHSTLVRFVDFLSCLVIHTGKDIGSEVQIIHRTLGGLGILLIKVSYFQNEFMKIKLLPKNERKIARISAL